MTFLHILPMVVWLSKYILVKFRIVIQSHLCSSCSYTLAEIINLFLPMPCLICRNQRIIPLYMSSFPYHCYFLKQCFSHCNVRSSSVICYVLECQSLIWRSMHFLSLSLSHTHYIQLLYLWVLRTKLFDVLVIALQLVGLCSFCLVLLSYATQDQST